MSSGLFGIGLSGLNAAQAGLLTTGHNISNAATPGFNRQQVLQSNSTPQLSGAGYFGTGVDVDTVRRIYSQFLDQQVVSSQARSSELDSYYAQLRQLDNVLADPSMGLSPVLQTFFAAVQDVATHPANAASRQSLLSAASMLDSRFELIDNRFRELRAGVDADIQSTIGTVNTYASEIARLNQAIVLAKGLSGGHPPNDLLDQRDRLVLDLNKLIRATTVPQDDGSLNVFIGNGQPLVAGVDTLRLVAVRDSQDSSRMTVGFQTPGGVTQLPESTLGGGSLGGLLAFRAQALDATQNALGRVAVVLAERFNAQHRLGQDLSGVLGGNFFSVAAPTVIAATGNTGNAMLSAAYADAGALTASDYRIAFDGANYTITRLSDSTQTVTGALPATLDGFTLTLASGAFAAGDSFVVRPTRDGAAGLSLLIGDPARIAAAAPIRTAQAATNTGTGSISGGSVNPPPPVDANLQQPVTINFTGPNTFDVTGAGTGNPVGLAYVPGQDISFNGWTVQISGAPAAGDSFTVGPNTGGIADNRNALLLGALQTAMLVGNGSASLQSAYAALVGDVGRRTNELEVTSRAEATLLGQHTAARESFSGVNLDEEAANLVRYQQAYQAAGKVLQVAATMFETILEIGR